MAVNKENRRKEDEKARFLEQKKNNKISWSERNKMKQKIISVTKQILFIEVETTIFVYLRVFSVCLLFQCYLVM